MPKPVVNILHSNRLFYGQYRWCGRFRMPECHALRGLDHRSIDRTVSLRRRWGRRMIERPVGSWRGLWEPLEITDSMVMDLHDLCDFLQRDPTPRRMRIQEQHVMFYCDDPEFLDRIEALGVARRLETTHIEIKGIPGTINLRHSGYRLRSYLRQSRLTEAAARSVSGFLLAQQDVRLSPSLTEWCTEQRTFMRAHYFFDHLDPGTAHMLNLIKPGLVKSTLSITTDK